MMSKKEYIQAAGVLVVAVVIGLTAAFLIDKTSKKAALAKAPTGDLKLNAGAELKVVSADPAQGSGQSNTDSSLTGVSSTGAPETSNPSSSSLQTTGQISVPKGSDLQNANR